MYQIKDCTLSISLPFVFESKYNKCADTVGYGLRAEAIVPHLKSDIQIVLEFSRVLLFDRTRKC